MVDSNNAKVYVAAKVGFRDDGVMLPREITWEDGTKFEVDRVLDIRQAPVMKAVGQGDRYTIKVRGQQSYGNNIRRWFVGRRI